MKIFQILITLIFLLFNNKLKADIILKFKIVDEKIILQIPDNSGNTLNILFDSGSNDFIIDSNYVRNVGITLMPDKNWGSSFLNGSIKSTLFSNESFFKELHINQLYPQGSMFDIKKLKLKCRVPIDGIIGINNNFLSNWVGIDFKKHELVISENPPAENKKNIRVLKMIYTDDNHKTDFSTMLRKLPASEVRVVIDSTHNFSTHVLFDTGFNSYFAVFGAFNVDSLVKNIKKDVSVEVKKQATLVNGSIQYQFESDSIIIDRKLCETKQRILIHRVDQDNMIMFGDLTTYCLAGVSFLKKFRLVGFDFLHREIHLYE